MATELILQTPKASAAPSSVPRLPRGKTRPAPSGSPDKVSVFSPYRPPPSSGPGDDIVDLSLEEFEDAADKTNHWVSIFFQGAVTGVVVFFGLICYAGYRGLQGRVIIISMVLLLASLAIIVQIIGIAGLILQKTTKVEPTIVSHSDKAAPVVLPVVLMEGFIPGINNQGNMCFINAPIQAVMNDSIYPVVYRDICQKGKKRGENYKKFLELYPSQSPFAISFPNIFQRKTDAPPPLAVEHIRDVLIMLTMRRSSFIKNLDQFLNKYPEIHQKIAAFSKITKEADFPLVVDTDLDLREEFGLMVQDREIVQFFYQERSEIAKELLGFEGFLFLLQTYQAALDAKSPLVSFGRGYVGSSPIDNIRNLIQGAEAYSQEDPDEFLRCLFKYALPEDYPDVFFPTYCECTWAECPAADQNPDELRERLAKHSNPRHEGDILTTMPANKTIREALSYISILKIDGFLREGISGQTLIDETFHKKNTDTKKGATFYLDVDGKVKKYYRVEEKIVIPPDKMPKKLILLLGRYAWIEREQKRVKVDCTVNMTETLKVGGHQYRLNSIVVHSPLATESPLSAEKGHYHALVKKGQKWLSASDSSVLEAEETHLKQALGHGSLYFYEKI